MRITTPGKMNECPVCGAQAIRDTAFNSEGGPINFADMMRVAQEHEGTAFSAEPCETCAVTSSLRLKETE